MKTHLHFKAVLFCLFIIATVNSNAQQEFTLNTVPANITSSQALINLPALNGNPNAIIIATPQGNTATLNTHPLGAWYYSGKWYLFNSDFAPMLVGLTYKIKYFINPGANEFLHLVTQQNLGAEGSYIDNPVLNSKPNAQFTILQNHSPDIRAGSWRNPNEAKAAYNASSGKWYITNINGQPIQKGCAYNIVMSSPSGTTGTDPVTNPPVGSCNCPAALPPNGIAGGDLGGTYPNPSVQKIGGYPVSAIAPQIGQVIKWNGTEWIPAEDNTGTVSQTQTAKPTALSFSQNANVHMTDPNVNVAAITGMSNQYFTLSQNSRIVFHTVISAYTYTLNALTVAHATGVQLVVEILNESNQVVARSTSDAWLTVLVPQTINSTGFGVLPAGKYHTRVSVNRQAGGERIDIIGYTNRQGGEIIIQIFPD